MRLSNAYFIAFLMGFDKRNEQPRRKQRGSVSLPGSHSVLDTESSRVFWIPAFAGMTNSRQASGDAPQAIQGGIHNHVAGIGWIFATCLNLDILPSLI